LKRGLKSRVMSYQKINSNKLIDKFKLVAS
jgi:hypothetical protein